MKMFKGNEIFRAKPETFYTHFGWANRVDENGNLTLKQIDRHSGSRAMFVQEFLNGNLVEVTDDPIKPIDTGEPKGAVEPVAETETPNIETFVEDEVATFAPPVDDAEPKPEPEPEPPRRKPGRPKGSKNKNQGGSK